MAQSWSDKFPLLNQSVTGSRGEALTVPYFGSERDSSEDEYVNVHMKTRHHRQSEFAGSVWKGEQESSVTLQLSYEVLPLAGKGVKARSHLLLR